MSLKKSHNANLYSFSFSPSFIALLLPLSLWSSQQKSSKSKFCNLFSFQIWSLVKQRTILYTFNPQRKILRGSAGRDPP